MADFYIDDLSMNQLISSFHQYDIHRNWYGMWDYVFSFLVENIDQMKTFVPQGYPCNMEYTSKYDQKYIIFYMGVGALVFILTLAIDIQTCYIR